MPPGRASSPRGEVSKSTAGALGAALSEDFERSEVASTSVVATFKEARSFVPISAAWEGSELISVKATASSIFSVVISETLET
jgi:hypothetical protein